MEMKLFLKVKSLGYVNSKKSKSTKGVKVVLFSGRYLMLTVFCILLIRSELENTMVVSNL
jgi:hypothetical protein